MGTVEHFFHTLDKGSDEAPTPPFWIKLRSALIPTLNTENVGMKSLGMNYQGMKNQAVKKTGNENAGMKLRE